MNNKKRFLVFAWAAAFFSALLLFAAWVFVNQKSRKHFNVPSFEQTAQSGTPEVDSSLGYAPLEIRGGFKIAVCSRLSCKNGVVDVFYTSFPENDVWTKLRITDENGKILGESGLIKPGEYVKSIKINEENLEETSKITMKAMGYQPETYTSEGSAVLNTELKKE